MKEQNGEREIMTKVYATLILQNCSQHQNETMHKLNKQQWNMIVGTIRFKLYQKRLFLTKMKTYWQYSDNFCHYSESQQ